jgi:microcystin-dependent protein
MNVKHLLLSASVVAAGLSMSTPAHSSADPLLGQIQAVGFNFCPRGWAAADGQLLAISSNSALFSLFGTIYGGDGRTTFALPDLRGRVPIHEGQGPGLTNRPQGSRSGTENETLIANQIPSHSHRAAIKTVVEPPNTPSPVGAAFTRQARDAYHTGTNPNPFPSTPGNPARFMNPENIYVEPTGGNQAHNNMQPYQVVNYCVATQGVFPSRN